VHDQRRVFRSDLLTPADIAIALQACERSRDRALIAVLWETGARISEIGNLQLAHVSKQESGYFLSLNGKTGTRTVLVASAASALREWLTRHPQMNEASAPLWPLRQGRGFLQYAALRSILRKCFRNAGISKRVYPHLFRHSRATYVLAAGIMNEAQVKAYFGWTPGSDMLAGYSHLIDRDADAAILREHTHQQTPAEILEGLDERSKAILLTCLQQLARDK
jgi:integrase/recombinase XerD